MSAAEDIHLESIATIGAARRGAARISNFNELGSWLRAGTLRVLGQEDRLRRCVDGDEYVTVLDRR